MTTTYYRIQAADRPNILDEENQYSYSWNDQGAEPRHGISVMRWRDDLAEYIAQTGIQWDETWEFIEVAGNPADDEDEDAHMGALLIIPTEIISREPITDGFMDEIFEAFEAAA
ncbi:hypothetical protein ACQX2J_01210 [Corynebacterium diphtheriae]